MQVEACDIQCVLNANRILKCVSIRAGERETVGVIGPNGSGKSTLLKCIYRILRPSGGAVKMDDKDLLDYTTKESARKIAVVAQHNYYNFDFSVQDVVLMGRSPHKRALDRDNAEDYRIVAQALETVGMTAFAQRSFALAISSAYWGSHCSCAISISSVICQISSVLQTAPTSGSIIMA